MSEETDALLPSAAAAASRREETNQNLVHRLTLIVGLVVVACLGIFFQFEVNGLSGQLQVERQRVDDLTKVIHVHEEVIDRFNTSVTNSDIMDRITTLQTDLDSAKTKLRSELKDVQTQVSAQLDQTVQELSLTVDAAEKEISNQVTSVKKDVEQYVLTTQDQFSMENNFMIYQLAGTFVVLSCLISMWHMTAHLRKLNQPDVQRKVLAILWMVPIYAVTSWLSLVFHSAEGYLAILKDGYEAYVIYQFLSFCIAVLGRGDRNVVVDMLAHRADHLTPPFRLLGVFEVCGCIKPVQYESNRALADAILLQCQFFAMQFVFFRPLTTTAMVVLHKLEYYGAGTGPEDWRSPQFYITIVQNVSIFTAFTGLLKFYHAVDEDLAWCRPFAKFLCIKCVVFMTFWQGLAITILAKTTDVAGEDADEWAKSSQNFLISLEMLLFSIAHFYCFPTEEWEEGYRVKHSQSKFGDSIALGDFVSDLKLILRSSSQTKKKKTKKTPAEPAIPEGDEEDDTTADDHSENTDALSAATSTASDTNGAAAGGMLKDEEQAMIANALEESLGQAGDDPDIAEAKKRLLESNVLSADMFAGDSDGHEHDAENALDESIIDEYVDELPGDAGKKGGDDDKYDKPADDLQQKQVLQDEPAAAEQYDPQRGIYSDSVYEEMPTESTRLLGGGSYYGDAASSASLRPSIFTAVASIADTDDDEEKKESSKKEQV